jgi:hypothetical protein
VRAACCGVGWTRTVSSADSASSVVVFSSDGGAVTSAYSSLEVFSSVGKTSSSFFSSSSSSLCNNGIGSTSPPASSKTRISKTIHQKLDNTFHHLLFFRFLSSRHIFQNFFTFHLCKDKSPSAKPSKIGISTSHSSLPRNPPYIRISGNCVVID